MNFKMYLFILFTFALEYFDISTCSKFVITSFTASLIRAIIVRTLPNDVRVKLN